MNVMSPLVLVQRKLNRVKRINEAQLLMAKHEGRSASVHLRTKQMHTTLIHRMACDNWLWQKKDTLFRSFLHWFLNKSGTNFFGYQNTTDSSSSQIKINSHQEIQLSFILAQPHRSHSSNSYQPLRSGVQQIFQNLVWRDIASTCMKSWPIKAWLLAWLALIDLLKGLC